MNVTTAVIMTAGYGSRMLPVTAAVQKELLPILNRPVIDYVVADCVAAGIKRIMFIIQPGSHGLQYYYTGNPELETHLQRQHKTTHLEELHHIHHQATFEFIEQPRDAGYGTAVPVLVAAPHLPQHEAVLVCGGDDFIWHKDGKSEIADFISKFNAANAVGAMMALERPSDQLHRYGVLSVRTEQGREYLQDFIEKPAAGEAPSNLINISKYLLTPKLIEYITRVTPDRKSGELYITDAILAAAHEHSILVHRADGRFLDSGNLTSWLEANQILSQTLTNK